MQQALVATDAQRRHRLARAVRRARRRERRHRPPGQRRSATPSRAIATLRTENAQRTRDGPHRRRPTSAAPRPTSQYDTLTDDLARPASTSSSPPTPTTPARSALVSGGITLGALLAAILLGLPRLADSCSSRIRKVREGARTVANEQLPEAVARIRAGEDPGPITPIDVTTHEEVGQLARAVDDLHRQAVTPGVRRGPAACAGRRDVHHPVAPQHLADQPAARPDRAAGEGRGGPDAAREPVPARPPRRPGCVVPQTACWSSPTPRRTPAPRTASPSPRRCRPPPPACRTTSACASAPPATRSISDEAAADVVHLLTELVDNALVLLVADDDGARSASTTAPDGVTVEIADAGLGIPDEALAEINETLRNGADVTPDTARRMGLFVVSRLAQRHGITVSLHAQRSNSGTTATVAAAPQRSWTRSGRPGPVAAAGPMTVPRPPPPQRASRDVAPTPLEPRGAARRRRADLPRRQPGAQAPETTPHLPSRAGRTAADAGPSARPRSTCRLRRDVAPPPASSHRRRALHPRRGSRADRRRTPPTGRPRLRLATSRCPSRRPRQPSSLRTEIAGAARVRRPSESAAAEHLHRRPDDASQHLDGDLSVLPLADSEAEADTPIFKALRSAWLSADATDEPGGPRRSRPAGTAPIASPTSLTEAPVNAAGLPVRRPGTRLVPGGVTKPATAAPATPRRSAPGSRPTPPASRAAAPPPPPSLTTATEEGPA